MFVDTVVITVKAGAGGAGAVAFRRQKYEPKGGPQGGDGGRGGDVVLRADEGLNTLLDFRGRPTWAADDGEAGRKKQQHGADGATCVVRVPPGTMVFDHQTGELITDIGPHESFTVAKGGGGGFGNEHYKNSVHQAPTHAHPGFPGDTRQLRLELKLLADVGLVGMPNAGKSTLLAALTKANPKIGDYPFTTLSPQLGVAELDPARRIVIADIPGLIEGASQGAGLGHDFLRHIERTRVLVHLLDADPPDGSTPAQNYQTIRNELYAYSPVLAERDEIIVLNKMDLKTSEEDREESVKKLRSALKLGREVEVFAISAAARQGTRALLERLWRVLKEKEHTWEGMMPAGAEKRERREAGDDGEVKEVARAVVKTPAKVVKKVPAKKRTAKVAKKAATKTAKKTVTKKMMKKTVAKKKAGKSRAGRKR